MISFLVMRLLAFSQKNYLSLVNLKSWSYWSYFSAKKKECDGSQIWCSSVVEAGYRPCSGRPNGWLGQSWEYTREWFLSAGFWLKSFLFYITGVLSVVLCGCDYLFKMTCLWFKLIWGLLKLHVLSVKEFLSSNHIWHQHLKQVPLKHTIG